LQFAVGRHAEVCANGSGRPEVAHPMASSAALEGRLGCEKSSTYGAT